MYLLLIVVLWYQFAVSLIVLIPLTRAKVQVIYCPKDVQLICLSATVANPDELAGWIGQVLMVIYDEFRCMLECLKFSLTLFMTLLA